MTESMNVGVAKSTLTEANAKAALDQIASGLSDGPNAQGISEWFISATIFKQAINSLRDLGIGYDTILKGLSYVFSCISKYGPDIATIVAKIVEEGRAIFYPE